MKWNNSICCNKEVTKDDHTKSEKSNYQKWYKWTCSQSRNRFTVLENKLTFTKREKLRLTFTLYYIQNRKSIGPIYYIEQRTVFNIPIRTYLEANMYMDNWITVIYLKLNNILNQLCFNIENFRNIFLSLCFDFWAFCWLLWKHCSKKVCLRNSIWKLKP